MNTVVTTQAAPTPVPGTTAPAIDAVLLVAGINYGQLPNDPSVPNPYPLEIGTLYTFQQAGVVLPAHAHTDANVHYTVIISGQFSILRDSAGPIPIISNPGDILDFAINEMHTVTCIEPGMMLNGLRYETGIPSVNAEVQGLQASATMLLSSVQTLNTAIQALPLPQNE
jgi:hypothetical protein